MPSSGRLAKKYLELLGSIELDRTTHFPHHGQESPLLVNNRCCPVPVSTGWKQDAQFLSSHGGCLSTGVVLYHSLFMCQGPDTYRCRPGLDFPWSDTFPVSGNVNLGLLVSTGPIFVYSPSPPLFEEITTVLPRGSGRYHFQGV